MPRIRSSEKIRCRVRECPNVRGSEDYNKQNGISFHRFPKNPHRYYGYLNKKFGLSINSIDLFPAGTSGPRSVKILTY
jgi:hypothetical protein